MTDIPGEPEHLFTDLPSVANLVLWTVVLVGILYEVPQFVVEVFT